MMQRRTLLVMMILASIFGQTLRADDTPRAEPSKGLEDLFQNAQRSVVKLYGAGGLKGLESYQSGVVIGDGNTILTSWSTVLDVDKVRVVTYDGRRVDAEVIGVDPECELALLKIEDAKLPGFQLDAKIQARPGQRVFSGYKNFTKLIDTLRFEQGTAIISTSNGVMSHIKASKLKKGGEILCYIG